MGYDAKKTKSSGDFGVDVIAERDNKRIVIQVKQHKNKITPREVQRTLGALHIYNADSAIFITTSDFTKSAREVENDAPIELWNKQILHQMVRRYFINGIE